MNKLLTITDLDATGEDLPFPETYASRSAARAIVSDADGKVALLYIAEGHFHKLPGGGIEEGEDISTALKREILEEIGCQAAVREEIGVIEEFRAKVPLRQHSYCFRAMILGEKGEPAFTKEEIAEGASVVWADSLAAAITLLENDQPTDWRGHFIVMRDLAFLKASKA